MALPRPQRPGTPTDRHYPWHRIRLEASNHEPAIHDCASHHLEIRCLSPQECFYKHNEFVQFGRVLQETASEDPEFKVMGGNRGDERRADAEGA